MSTTDRQGPAAIGMAAAVADGIEALFAGGTTPCDGLPLGTAEPHAARITVRIAYLTSRT